MHSQFHITIGLAPTVGSHSLLAPDLRMVKAALLYADKVKLCSMVANMLISRWDQAKASPANWADLLIHILSVSTKGDPLLLNNLKRYKELSHKRGKSKSEMIEYLKLKTNLERSWEKMQQDRQVAAITGAEQLRRASEAGLIEFYSFKNVDSRDSMAYEFFNVIKRAVLDNATYPLFDALTGELVRFAVRKGQLNATAAALQRGKHSALATNLLNRLPLFDEASIDEILDIRTQLQGPLIRFRTAMIRFSQDINPASWDADFSMEAELIFRREVEPAVLEIEEAVKSNGYLAKLARNVIDKPLTLPSGSFLGVVLGQLSALPEIVTSALGGIVAAGLIGYDAYNEWKEKTQEIERNQLFFYYKAGKLLEE